MLQERQFDRVGGGKAVQADVRVIAATHRDLEAMIRTLAFREDLYYRLNVFPIETPPLRDRADDIPLLLQELLNRHAEQHKGIIRLTQRAMESLMQYAWPGNVRELRNFVERSLLFGEFPLDSLGSDGVAMEPAAAPPSLLLAEVEKRFPGDIDLLRSVSLIDEGDGNEESKRVRMAHLSIVGSHRVNGVSKLHSDLMVKTIFAGFAKLYPDRFDNKTNGVTPRRWLGQANPDLAGLLDRQIGKDWRLNLERLRERGIEVTVVDV